MLKKETRRSRYFLVSIAIVIVLILGGCASSKYLLNRAEAAWAQGAYAESINMALDSYEKAVDKNKKPEEIDAAKAFLMDRFPQADENLRSRASAQDNGSESEMASSWKTWQVLVSLNRRVKDSVASSFLETHDYSENLAEAKKTAAQIRYVSALELMGEDKRESYIEAAAILKEIESQLYPGFRDTAALLDLCYENGTLTVAFSNRDISYTVRKGSINTSADYVSTITGYLRSYIEKNDHPDFLKFINSASAQAARDSGAALYIEAQGDIWVSSGTRDSYTQDGRITWERSYGGTPILSVTRFKDNQTEIASAPLSFSQTIQVEFYPQRYQTDSLTADLYNSRFNNADWMDFQLLAARVAVAESNGNASLSVWAQMEYGGIARFLTEAKVLGDDGSTVKPIDPGVYDQTEIFINRTLPDFLTFSDLDLQARISEEVTDAFLSTGNVKNLLANLE